MNSSNLIGHRTTLLHSEENVIRNNAEMLAPWRARWIKKLTNPVYMGALLVSNLTFSVFLLYADLAIYWKANHFWGIMVTAVFINFVFFVDLIANFLVLGPKNVWKEKGFMYIEVILQIA